MKNLDALPVGLAVLSRNQAQDFVLVEANQDLWDIVDVDAQEPGIGVKAELLVAPEERRALIDAIQRNTDQASWRLTLQVRKQGGERAWAGWRVKRSFEGSEEVLVVAVADITETVRTQSLLQEREQQATSLAASLPGAIFTHILLPDGRDKIEFMSSGSHRLWEISPQDAVGDPALLWGQVVPEDVNALAESIKRSAETGEDWNAQWSDPDTFRPIQVS